MALQQCRLNLNHAHKELQPHGTLAFPCAGYASTHSSGPEHIIPWHWHEEIEVIHILSGTMELRIPGQSFQVQQGDLAIVNGNILHYAEGAPKCTLQSLVFSSLLLTGSSKSSFAEKYLQPLMNCKAFSCVVLPKDAGIASLFSDAFDALSQDAFAYEFTVREKLSEIMLNMYRLLEPQIQSNEKTPTTDNRRVELMLDYIHRHFHQAITLQDISAAGQVGERECLRCFQRTIGESPIQYLLKYRLMRSAQLLQAEPDKSILDLAGACGFSTPSYFTKQFRRYYSCTPKDYRKGRERM